MVAVIVAFVGVGFAYARPVGWAELTVPGICTIAIPPTLEVQSGAYRKMSDEYYKLMYGGDQRADRVVVQPLGINVLDSAALKRYCRFILEVYRGNVGEYLSLDDFPEPSLEELAGIDAELKRASYESAALMTSKGQDTRILSWKAVSIKRFKNFPALGFEYIRTVNGAPPVRVISYYIQDNDIMLKVDTSYRIAETDLWADDLALMMESLVIFKR